MLPAVEQFNADYSIVRKMVIKGMLPVKAARAWIAQHGYQVIKAAKKESYDRDMRQYGLRADKELQCFRIIELKEEE